MSKAADEDLTRRLLKSYPRSFLLALAGLAEETHRQAAQPDRSKARVVSINLEFRPDGCFEQAMVPRRVGW
jgi:hypothetical protein